MSGSASVGPDVAVRVRWVDKQSAPHLTLGVPWFPVVRHNNRDENTGTWMGGLTQPPAVVATGIDFAHQIMGGRHEHSLRERLGVPTGTLVLIHGQVRHNALEKVWDGHEEFLEWARDEAVDGVLSPQFTDDEEVPDLDRAFDWYRAAVNLGFPYSVFQHPGAQSKRHSDLLQECYDFAANEGVKFIACSIGKDRGRGGLLAPTARDHQLCREHYPADSDFLHFGTSTALRMKMAAKLLGYFEGAHGITFSNVVAATAAAFYMRVPERATAPPDWSKGQVFAHNVAGYEALAAKALVPSSAGRKRRGGRSLRSRAGAR